MAMEAGTMPTDPEARQNYATCDEGKASLQMFSTPTTRMMSRVRQRLNVSRLHNCRSFRRLRSDGSSEFDRFNTGEFDSTEGMTLSETVITLTGVTLGAGLMVLPFAVQRGGWIVLVLLVVLSCWSGLSLWMLGDLLRELDKHGQDEGIPRENRGWNVIARAALGESGRHVVEVIFMLECYGMFVSYLILSGRALHLIIPSVSTEHLIMYLGAAVIVLIFVPQQYLSMFGIVSVLCNCSIIVGLIATGVELGGWEHAQSQHRPFVNFEHLATCLGTISYVYSGHASAPMFFQGMQDRTGWPTAILWAMSCAGTFTVVFAALGYGIFGASVQQSVLENLGRGMDLELLDSPMSRRINHSIGHICGGLVAFDLLISAPPSFVLPFVSAVEFLTEIQRNLFAQLMWRIVFMTVTILLAAAFCEKLIEVVSFVGCITNNLMSYGLPAFLYLLIRWDHLNSFQRIFISSLVFLSAMMLVIGGYKSVVGLAS